MRRDNISMAVIRRMPKYYRYLDELHQNGVDKISSRALAEQMGLTASQIRQDFNCFGGFGQQGYGYHVETLRNEIASIIGIDRKHNAIILGVGNIGRALIRNFQFSQCGFSLLAAFDADAAMAGDVINKVPVLHIDELERFCKENRVEIAILTIPSKYAQTMAAKLTELGIKGLWNFTNVELKVCEDVIVEDVHFSDSMMTLCYRISEE
ncbi:MAG: redox-sensing transcriptional repressor Rex [Oscillospiraceae bacterium]|nr:redox-sensing transcriptional repressor Rex [Oscillospiraceae bacterium]